MKVLAIDPGNKQSALVSYDTDSRTILRYGIHDNLEIRQAREEWKKHTTIIAIEYMRPRGMPISREELDTMFEAGRIVEAIGMPHMPISRHQVKTTICGRGNAKDSNVRAAIIDWFGGKSAAIGLKAEPGPLYEIKKDLWQALAVAITYCVINGIHSWSEQDRQDLRD